MIKNITRAFEDKKYTIEFFYISLKLLLPLIAASYSLNHIIMESEDYPMIDLAVM